MIKLALALTSLAAAAAMAQTPPAPRPAPRPAPAPAPARAPAPRPTPRAETLPRGEWHRAPLAEIDLWELEERARSAALRAEETLLTTTPMALAPSHEVLLDHARLAEVVVAAPAPFAATTVEAMVAEAHAAAAVAPRAETWGPPPSLRLPEAWAQQDPADSLYRLGREAVNRGDNRRAAAIFQQIAQRYPRSAYAADAAYWEAWSRYRIGTEAELRTALGLLDGYLSRTGQNTASLTSSQRTTRSEAVQLATRIRGMVAVTAQNAAEAHALTERLEQQARRTGDGCDREEVAVRVEALNALARIDSTSVLPHLRRVLENDARCAEGLRDRAVFLLARQPGGDAEALLVRTAESDPSAIVRASAAGWLGRRGSDRAVDVLGRLVRADTAQRVRASALGALAAHQSPRARQVLRSYAEGDGNPLRMRMEAVEALRRDTSSANAAYLRQLYGRVDTVPLQEMVIAAVARIPGEENARWLSQVVGDENAPTRLRRQALSGLMRRDLSIAEVGRLYDGTALRELREEVLNTLARRKEPEATDKLLAIARSDSDPRMRRAAISALSRKDDPRTTKLLLDILDRPAGQ